MTCSPIARACVSDVPLAIDEEVGHVGDAAQVEQDDVLGLGIERDLGGALGEGE